MIPFPTALPVRTLLLAASLLLAAPSTGAASSALPLGEPVGEFTALDENGDEHRLSQYRGKTVVLEWTNPDCPYVQRHYRSGTMKKLAARYGTQGVVWLAVNSTHYNKPEQTREWRRSEGFEYVTLQDPEGTLGRRFGARTTPHMFVIDGKGVLRYAGAIDDDPRGRNDDPRNYVDAGLTSLLRGATVDPSTSKPYGCSVKYR